MAMIRLTLALVALLTPAAFAAPQGYAALGTKVAGTDASTGQVTDACAFLNSGARPTTAKTTNAPYADACTTAGLPAGVCFACDGNPGNGSQTCRDAIKRYRELGVFGN